MSHSTLRKFTPFWLFLVFFKFGAGLHFSVIAPLGEKLFPLWVVGLLIGGSAFIQLLLDIPAGHLLDKLGYRRLLKITTLLFVLTVSCFLFGLTQFTYLLSIGLGTFGWLFFGPGINAYILSWANQRESGRFISLRDTFESVGIVLSSATFAFLLKLPVPLIGAVIIVPLFIAYFAISISPQDRYKIPTEPNSAKRRFFTETLRAITRLNPASTMLLLSGLSASMFYGIIWFVVPLVAVHAIGISPLGLSLGIFDFSVVTLGYFIGKMADTLNKRVLVFFGLLLFGLMGALIGFHLGWLFLLFGFLATTGDEMAGISLWSWLHTLDKDHARDGAVSGVINLFQDLGWAIGPIIAGFTYDLIGPSWTIFIGAVPILCTWVIYQFISSQHKPTLLAIRMIPRKPHRYRHHH